MKKLIVTLVLASVFTLVFTSAVSAQPNKPLRCELTLTLDMSLPGWKGDVTGDIAGTIEYVVDLSALWFSDEIEHYSGTWEIKTARGTISGFSEGISMSRNKFMWLGNGGVTAATGDWGYLVGCHEHEQGTTFTVDDSVHGIGTMTMMQGSGKA